ncbi:MAG: T9SS type A sorting domain-containing protein [Saprospiraceae bacterium]|nr:T9SS type A sorting domain-containing protein [Saprospiraceae bacterium]
MARIALLFILFGCLWTTSLSAQHRSRTCGTAEGYLKRLESDPEFRSNISVIEKFTTRYVEHLREHGGEGARGEIVTIPVVVHVVYNSSTENISDAQIQSQIDVLNRDFRALNSDISRVPSVFSPLAADCRIQFALAKRDPNCEPTNGITRTYTSTTSFTRNPSSPSATVRNPMKFTSSGGRDGWNPEEYLNIWVCDLGSGLLGYAAFPADLATRPAEDGVVIDYQSFGTMGTAAAPFNLGRTTTHEVGHWLNLRHIWGDDQFESNVCSFSDFVDDTPDQDTENYNCPSFPHVSCFNGPNGDLFMNYMDYVDDDCMFMFTKGQSQRMDATLFGVRASLIGSDGTVPPGEAPTPDLWSQDTPDDTGIEPNPTSLPMWQSADIWVRNTNDGFLNQEHQNPIGGQTNYIYARIRNSGCVGSQSGTVKLYWAKASSGLAWPAPWDGTMVASLLMGDDIGSSPVTVNAGDFEIVELPWVTPNPNDYASFGSDKGHFCLLSRIETSSTVPYGMAFAETSNFYQNVQRNNNIVWKNISVASPTEGRLADGVLVNNYLSRGVIARLQFNDFGLHPNLSLFQHGKVSVDLGEKLFEIWSDGGRAAQGVSFVRNSTKIYLNHSEAALYNIKLPSHEQFPIEVFFEPFDENAPARVYQLNLEQIDQETQELLGGQTFRFKTDTETSSPNNILVETNCPSTIPPKVKFPVNVVAHLGQNHQLSAFYGVLRWNPEFVNYLGGARLTEIFDGSLRINQSAGEIIFYGKNPNGINGSFELFGAIFEATPNAATFASQAIELTLKQFDGLQGNTDLLPITTTSNCNFTVTWNGNNLSNNGANNTSETLSVQAHPNPFRDELNIQYYLADASTHVNISVFSTEGKRVKVLYAGQQLAGTHQITWDGKNEQHLQLPNGLYFLQVTSDAQSIHQRILLVRD